MLDIQILHLQISGSRLGSYFDNVNTVGFYFAFSYLLSAYIALFYKKKYEFGQILSTFNKKEGGDLLHSFRGTGNIFRDVHNLKNKDTEVRKEAREKYSRKDHVDFLVNCRISEIINKKLEIESRLHIKQAENESYNHSR